jgi:agmatinase
MVGYFADADTCFEDADFVIFGVPYDKTSSFRHGADKAPEQVRHNSWNFETFDFRNKVDLRDVKIHDYGDVDVKNLGSAEMIEKVKGFTGFLLRKNKFPIAIGGEHSITPGIIQVFPKDIGVLCFDAHLDFRDKYENDMYNHACAIRRIAEYVDNVAVIGVRSAEREEFERAEETGLFYIDAFSFLKEGVSEAVEKIRKILESKNIYLTVDIDVVDPAYAPGTSTPEPFGLKPLEVLECIEFFSSQIVGFDVVEVCPPYDNGESSLLAAKLIRSITACVWEKRFAYQP